MIDEIKSIASKVPLEQFDIDTFSKDKIRDLFRAGKVPTADAMVDEIILRAVKSGANDIHFEPAENELRVRLGREGVLKKLVNLPKEISENLANVLKTKAGMNVFEKKKPQEGRFSITIGTRQFDLRVSTIPTMTGERVAIRILQKKATVADLDELGFTKEELEKFRAQLRHPRGLLLIVGPSSSGKSTTLSAAIKDLHSPEKNIITIENPVEYKLDFASQVQSSFDKSFTEVDALRAVLRQNPNVIMLGEIRDAETGIAAAEAALSGNLVLSTMLSNDAVSAIPRLLNLGIPAYWLASTLSCIVYQQLIRKICNNCREEIKEEIKDLEFFKQVSQQPKFYRGRGCDKCNNSGYLGQTGVFEILVIDDKIRDLIYQNASILKLKEAAVSTGFESILKGGAKRVVEGITTVEEFNRVLC